MKIMLARVIAVFGVTLAGLLAPASLTPAATQDRSAGASPTFPYAARVAVPVADLRREPSRPGNSLSRDPLEESQLLYGDRVTVLEENGAWAKVRADEQQEWSRHQRWEGYPGWVLREALHKAVGGWQPNLGVVAKIGRLLESDRPDAPVRMHFSLGTRLMGERSGRPGAIGWKIRLLDGSEGWIRSEEVASLEELADLRKQADLFQARLVATARSFLGDPYYWGGRSSHDRAASGPPHWAVDCSGLVGLVYQANGILIPRDAHEQWLGCQPISQEELKPADLVFLFDPQDKKRVTHVMLYIGGGSILEAPGTGFRVRELPLLHRLKEAQSAGRGVAYGTYNIPSRTGHSRK